MEIPQHVTSQQIAASLGCSIRTVQRMRAEGQIPAVRLRREYRYDPAAVTLALSRSATNSDK
jgi:excisionase family DNA binding protein